MSIEIVFETHALSEHNERGIATGWLPGRLSQRGRDNAAQMGRRRRDDGIAAVFSSDLRRSVETAEIAFGETDIPILYDWRLRECDFGLRNGTPAAELRRDREDYLDRPYPGGESRRQAVHRVKGLLVDLPARWAGQRVLLIGHVATQHALEHVANGIAHWKISSQQTSTGERKAGSTGLNNQPETGVRVDIAHTSRPRSGEHDVVHIWVRGCPTQEGL